MNREISDELLNAFADNELDGVEKAELLECIAADDKLRAKVCETWHLKELVRSAHPLEGKSSARKKSDRWRMLGLPLAACLLLMVGAGSGWLAHERSDEVGVSGAELRSIQARGGRVLLHLVSGEPDEIERALRMATQLADARDDAGAPLRVELIVNGTGIKLVNAANARFADRVVDLRARHANVRLVACNETMNRMRERGVDVSLLPSVEVVPSAIEEIATRIDQGWRYMQV